MKLSLMLCMFRCKLFFVVNYFQQNQFFLEKIIFLKIIFGIWVFDLYEKITNKKKQPMTKF